jgi:hypothetical protein
MRLVPKGQRRGKDREYALDEIRKILSIASLHLKVAILFMCSSGIRVGAFDYLTVGNVTPVKVDGKLACGKVLTYAGEGDDEYETLISKEAYLTFQDYVESRKNAGEEVTDDSPLIVTRGGRERCKVGTIMNSINKLVWKAGIRKEVRKRYDIQTNHGFRKFFDNVANDYIDKPYVEFLIGHDRGTQEHYDRHLPKPAIEQYLRAMPYLSIDQAYRTEAELSGKLERAEENQSKDFTDLRLRLLEKDSEVKGLAETVKKQEATLKEVFEILNQIKEDREAEIKLRKR